MIKKENKSIAITLRPKDIEYLNIVKKNWKIKTYGNAIRHILEWLKKDKENRDGSNKI